MGFLFDSYIVLYLLSNPYLMKNILSFLFLLIAVSTFAQKQVTAENYYDYFIKGPATSVKGAVGNTLTTNWLRENEVVPIIMEELKNAGYEWLYDYSLFQISDNQYIVLSAYCRKSNFGFLYITGHAAFPNKSHRVNLTQKADRGVDYMMCTETVSGEPKWVKIETLPENVFVLNENCYWYQYTDNPKDNEIFFSREDAIKILRADIKAYLAKRPK